MIIDHNHPDYVAKWKTLGEDKYNGAYYYSKEIVKNIIPNVKTDRNWVTIRLAENKEHPDHSIVFIHNNRNPNYYEYLQNYKDCILVCGLPSTAENVSFFGKTIYLPLSVDVKAVEKYKVKNKTKDKAYAGRSIKLNYATSSLPKDIDILCNMPQSKLLREMAKYKTIYATGRTAIQAKVLGCHVESHDVRFQDASIWQVLDNREAAKMLQEKLDEIDGV
jgi:hypothetical protein